MPRCFWTGRIDSAHSIRCLTVPGRDEFRAESEDAMATKQNGQIVESATEARQAEPGPSVLALLSMSTGLAVIILAIVWFVFFRT